MRGGKHVGDISTPYLFILASLFSLNDNISRIHVSNFISSCSVEFLRVRPTKQDPIYIYFEAILFVLSSCALYL